MNGDDFWRELMEEIPGGENHGRQRSHDGGWVPLGTEEHQPYDDDLSFHTFERQSPYHRFPKPEDTIRHGTRSGYATDGCRCKECKAANAAYMKARRNVTSLED